MCFHKLELRSITGASLLPVLASISAAASGGVVAEILPNSQDALITVIVSYALWGTSVPLAMIITAIYFYRLNLHQLPPRERIVSVFIPIGPPGLGGFALLQLGKVSMQIFSKTNTLNTTAVYAGDIFYLLGLLQALILWGFGIVWIFFAVCSIWMRKFPFNMGWWAFTFPMGVFATSTVLIGVELPSAFFKVLGTVSIFQNPVL